MVGGLTFVPWLPIFLFQSAHTGTPWATPANFAAMVNAVASFAGGRTNQGRALALLYFALVGLGLFGVATDRRHIELDIRTRPLGRPLGLVVVGTLAPAITGGFLTNSAFDARYASVVFVPLILLVALGLGTFSDRRSGWGCWRWPWWPGWPPPSPTSPPTGPRPARWRAAIAPRAAPATWWPTAPTSWARRWTACCPPTATSQITFPRGTGPEFVNWVDYGDAVPGRPPGAVRPHLEAMAAGGHQIFVVWAPGYQTFGTKCEEIVQTLQAPGSGYTLHNLVQLNATSFYQPMDLYQFTAGPRLTGR